MNENINENDSKFLIYKIGDELYGSPLLSIREVLEYQRPKHMPNMVNHFSGVVNVRGAIVGVVDLRKRFGYPEDIGRRTSLLLCDTNRGPIAAIVDGVESVLQLEDDEIEKAPPVKLRARREDLIGVGKSNDQLIIIIDLHESLSQEEFKAA